MSSYHWFILAKGGPFYSNDVIWLHQVTVPLHQGTVPLFWVHQILSKIRYKTQALTTPLAQLPGIAWNDRLATIFVGRSWPPSLYFEIGATNVFLCQTAAYCTLYALDFERCSAKWLSVESTFVYGLNDLISTVFSLITWSVKYWTLIWIINGIMQIRLQYLLVINRYSKRQWYYQSCRNGHNVWLQNIYCVRNTRLWLNTGPWAGLLIRIVVIFFLGCVPEVVVQCTVVSYLSRKSWVLCISLLRSLMMCAYNRVNYGPMVVSVCLHINYLIIIIMQTFLKVLNF